jgi:DNA-binding HxlR family transcriptional regulator
LVFVTADSNSSDDRQKVIGWLAVLRLSVCMTQPYKTAVSMSNKALVQTDRHLADTIGADTIGAETVSAPMILPPAQREGAPGGCGSPCVIPKEAEDLVRDLLVRFGDKWSMRAMDELYERGALRFSRLREHLPGISQKMLTQTLRQLERDGVVLRRVYAEVPPRVDYELTPDGIALAEALCGLWEWAIQNTERVAAARQAFDMQVKTRKDD